MLRRARRLDPGDAPGRPPGASLTQAIAALFAAGAVTDLTPYLGPTRPTASGGTLASRPVWPVPRMRPAEARAARAARHRG